MPFALGEWPRQVSGTLSCLTAGTAVQPFPRSLSTSRDARAALMPACVWCTAGAPVASTIARSTLMRLPYLRGDEDAVDRIRGARPSRLGALRGARDLRQPRRRPR